MGQNDGGEKKRKSKTESLKQVESQSPPLATPIRTKRLNPVQTKPVTVTVSAIKEQWKVDFSRFFPYPPPLLITSTCPLLVPQDHNYRRRYIPSDRWISLPSSSSAMLQLAPDHSSSDVILTVCFNGKLLEEHYVSKLLFIWPQVSCISGFPARGTRAVFVNYKDCSDQIQKFGLRFSSLQEAEKFMNALKKTCKERKDIEPVNTDLGSEISSQFELTSSSRTLNQTCKDVIAMTPSESYTPQISPSLLSNEAAQCSHTQEFTSSKRPLNQAACKDLILISTTPAETYTPQISPSLLNNEADQYSYTQEFASSNRPLNRDAKDLIAMIPDEPYRPQISPSLLNTKADQYSHTQESTPIDNYQSNFAALPPSFASFLSNCGPVLEHVATQPVVSEEVDLKSKIARYMEDASFQDLLFKVDKMITEMGDDILL